MTRYELIAPCHFGLEAVLKKEIIDLGYEIQQVEDGRVTFEGDEEAICRANVFLRTTERIMIKVGKFKAYTFDELFEKTKALEWERFIPEDGKFWVTKASSIKSKLFSTSDIQRLTNLECTIRYCNHINFISLLFSTIYKFLFSVTCILLTKFILLSQHKSLRKLFLRRIYSF